MLVKVPLIPSEALTGTETGAWIDMAKHAGTVRGVTVECSAFTSGTFDVVVYTSPDQASTLILATCDQVTGTGYDWNPLDTEGATVAPDAMRYVRAVATGASTPVATIEVNLWLTHD